MTKTNIEGGWVVLRDPKQVTERHRRPLITLITKALKNRNTDVNELDADTLEMYSEFNDGLAVALIESWSFGDEVSVDVLLDLPASTCDALRLLVAPLAGELMPNFEPSPDSKVITDNSTE